LWYPVISGIGYAVLQVIDNNNYGVKGWLCRNEHAGAFEGKFMETAEQSVAVPAGTSGCRPVQQPYVLIVSWS
jgi:hypothetical protein